MSEAKKEPEAGAEEAKPKSKKKLVVIIAVVLVLILGGVGGFVAFGGAKEEETENAEPEEIVPHLVTVTLDPIIVNLSESSSFLKVILVLEYDSALLESILAKEGGEGGGGGHGGGGSGGEKAAPGGLPPPLTEREPMIKDAIIKVLSSKNAKELLTADGKEVLKEELLEAINEASGLEQSAVVAVYFKDFIIQ